MEEIDIDFDDDEVLAAPERAQVFRMPKLQQEAKPRYANSTPQSSVMRSLPKSTDAEEGLLACCILNADCIDRALAQEVTDEFFFAPAHQQIWRALVMLRKSGATPDEILLAQALDDAGELSDVGGLPFINHLTNRVETAIHWQQFAGVVREKAEARALIRRAAVVMEAAYSGEDPAEILDGLARDVDDMRTAQAACELPMVPLTHFQVIDDDDESVLLGNRYMVRGDIGILVSHAGVGKSAMSTQMVVTWAIANALGFFGIRSNGPLRQLIVQAEDSEADIAEVCESIYHGLKLSREQIKLVEENTRVVRNRINRGDSFLRALEGYVKRWSPDIVWLNPLQAYVDGDITQGQDCGKFLREGLNRVNREEKFAYMLVHHTTKPPSGQKQNERAWHEHMYDMAGGAELVNTARLIMSLKAREEEGKFYLMLAKRGNRAGVCKEVEQGAGTRLEVCTKIPLQHCKEMIEVTTKSGRKKRMPMVFWQADTDPEPEDNGKAKTGGRPRKWPDGDVLKMFPVGHAAREPIGTIMRRARDTYGMTEGSFRNYHARFLEEARVVLENSDSKWYQPTA